MATCRPHNRTPSRILLTRPHYGISTHQIGLAVGTRRASAPLITLSPAFQSNHAQRQARAHLNTARQFATSQGPTLAEPVFSADDVLFLSKLGRVKHHVIGDAASRGPSKPTYLRLDPIRKGQEEETGASTDQAISRNTVDPMDDLHQFFSGALEAMQRHDSRSLLTFLDKITRMPEHELINSVAKLPRTTFSELLRCLDPLETGRQNEPTRGVPIGPGAWQQLSLGAVLDEWGIRVLYTRLLRQLLILMRALQHSGQLLNVNDYIPLFRAAGFTSDIAIVKLLWNQMVEHDIHHWRNSTIYNEYIRARFLVDPAYAGYDKRRLVMNPRNLHRRGHLNLHASIRRLDGLRKNLRQWMFRFGLDKNVDHAEDLSRILRKRMPITRLFWHMQMYGVRLTEKVLCDLMVAFARAGSLRFVQFRILEDYFGIRVRKDVTTGQISVQPVPSTPKTTKDPFRPSKPVHIPTALLIKAVVYTYCCNGQLPMALQIVSYISTEFKIHISQKVWFELLEWAHILTTPPVSSAWRMANFTDRIPKSNATEIIWNTMTQPPYNAQPGFREYDYYIRHLLATKNYRMAMEQMRCARSFYDKQCVEFENAAFEYASARSVGINPARELRAFQRARFLKAYMRQRMNGWCNMFFVKKYKPRNLFEGTATRTIPEFIHEWRDLLDNPVRYRTASGFVRLLDPAEPVEKAIFVRDHVVGVPMRRSGAWQIVSLSQKQYRLRSKHSLGDLMSTRAHPLEIMRGVVPRGRPLGSRRLQKHLARKAAKDAKATAAVAVQDQDQEQISEAQSPEDKAPEPDIWDDDEL